MNDIDKVINSEGQCTWACVRHGGLPTPRVSWAYLTPCTPEGLPFCVLTILQSSALQNGPTWICKQPNTHSTQNNAGTQYTGETMQVHTIRVAFFTRQLVVTCCAALPIAVAAAIAVVGGVVAGGGGTDGHAAKRGGGRQGCFIL